jgi:hypothetical protein
MGTLPVEPVDYNIARPDATDGSDPYAEDPYNPDPYA